MRFSVLVPMYNSELYIAECIDSILSQYCDDYEIIVVDDGSVDSSSCIVDQLCAKNSRINIIHNKNSGVLLTRRIALKAAIGEYVLWVDSDDTIKSNLTFDLSKVIDADNPDIIIWNYELCSQGLKKIKSVKTMEAPNELEKNYIERENLYHQFLVGKYMNNLWTKCIKLRLIDTETDYTEYKHVSMGDDRLCLLPIIDKANTTIYLNNEYYRYRMTETSITHTYDYSSYSSYRTIFEHESAYFEKWDVEEKDKSVAKDVFAYRITDLIYMCVNSDNTTFSDYYKFVSLITKDELITPILEAKERSFKSPIYKNAFMLHYYKRYHALFLYVKITSKLSKMKKKLTS